MTAAVRERAAARRGQSSGAEDGRTLFRRRFRDRPLPLRLSLLARQALAGVGPDALLPRGPEIAGGDVRLQAPLLAADLRGTRWSAYAMAPSSLDRVVHAIVSLRPARVLEFGSGVSTVILASVMARLHGREGPPHLFTVEQCGRVLQRTRRRLRRLGAAGRVRLLHAPLGRQVIRGFRTVCYAPGPGGLTRLLDGRKADFVLIDGPAGPHGCRFGVLPLAAHVLAPGATIFLDDALRDSELAAAQWWERLGLLHRAGIHWVGKGLLRGGITPGLQRLSPECVLLRTWLSRAVARNPAARVFRLRPPGEPVAT